MKRIIVVFALFMTTMVSAQNVSKVDSKSNSLIITSKKPNQYQLAYTPVSQSKVRISVFNEKGNHLRTDYFTRSGGFGFTYDFSALPMGNYHVRLLDGKKIHRATISHSNQAPGNLSMTLTPIGKDTKFNLRVERDIMKPVWVNIYNADSKIIFTDKIDVDFNFSRVYDLNKSYTNARAIEVYSDGKLVKKAVN